MIVMTYISIIYTGSVFLGLISHIAMVLAELDKHRFDPSIQSRKEWRKSVKAKCEICLIYLIPVLNIAFAILTFSIAVDIIRNNRNL